MLNSMDVLVVINRPSAFGEHSYPVKLYEAMSCDVPVVATRTRATEWILRDRPESLVTPDDPRALANAILAELESPVTGYGYVPTWESGCDIFERALEKARR
jgi:glycosyltransferase involved in cell wall biosynthesis